MLGPNITGSIYNSYRFLYCDKDGFAFTNNGALTTNARESGGQGCTSYANGAGVKQFNIDASFSNSIYTDSGTILPLSISKNSYIVYK